MLRNLGGIRQLGMVVRDARKAMLYLAEVHGIGPFYVAERVTFDDYRYYGEAAESPVVTLGYAQSGDLQFEVIEQHDDCSSGYRDFLASGREGLQHLSAWFGNSAAFDKAYADAVSSGARVVHEGNAGGPRFAYLSTIGVMPYGFDFELAEGLLPMVEPSRRLLSEAARDWDGCDPIRKMPG